MIFYRSYEIWLRIKWGFPSHNETVPPKNINSVLLINLRHFLEILKSQLSLYINSSNVKACLLKTHLRFHSLNQTLRNYSAETLSRCNSFNRV